MRELVAIKNVGPLRPMLIPTIGNHPRKTGHHIYLAEPVWAGDKGDARAYPLGPSIDCDEENTAIIVMNPVIASIVCSEVVVYGTNLSGRAARALSNLKRVHDLMASEHGLGKKPPSMEWDAMPPSTTQPAVWITGPMSKNSNFIIALSRSREMASDSEVDVYLSLMEYAVEAALVRAQYIGMVDENEQTLRIVTTFQQMSDQVDAVKTALSKK